jgi:hypothetical protein
MIKGGSIWNLNSFKKNWNLKVHWFFQKLNFNALKFKF